MSCVQISDNVMYHCSLLSTLCTCSVKHLHMYSRFDVSKTVPNEVLSDYHPLAKSLGSRREAKLTSEDLKLKICNWGEPERAPC